MVVVLHEIESYSSKIVNNFVCFFLLYGKHEDIFCSCFVPCSDAGRWLVLAHTAAWSVPERKHREAAQVHHVR